MRHPCGGDGYGGGPDRGQALGCALYAWYCLTGTLPRRSLAIDCFGRDHTDEEIQDIQQALCRVVVRLRR
ncbi:hypothetical protein [Streptomyces sp. PSKA30]|uniref:hypothetical protein n=1 Tax=Streptomyces sp. PSKA30 TaxID=2874597 RepID=UPI001CD0C5DD|nr:hypothetical protein [Streptomyces sp. PSKA30]MBZ9639963.1 hypothetical protein [Streptomyces sp. PSKA30]